MDQLFALSATMRIRNLALASSGVLALAVAAAIAVSRPSAPAFQGFAFEPPAEAADFQLVDHTGEPASLRQFRGHPVLLFFGFTHCPDVCPLTLAKLNRAVESLGDYGREVRILLVSTDPARDTPAAMEAYVARFGPRVVGLTGDSTTLAAVRAAYGVYAGPHPGDASHGMTHTASVWGIDRQGHIRVLLPMELPDDAVAADVRGLAGLK